MSDLEITRLCAEASEVWKEAHKWFPTWTLDATFSGIREANGQIYLVPNNPMRQDPQLYDPLHDDAQAMALVKKFKLHLEVGNLSKERWLVCRSLSTPEKMAYTLSDNLNLNRAICECVAKMQQAKHV